MKREEIAKALEKLHQKVSSSQNPSKLEIDILKDDVKELYNKVLEWEKDNQPVEAAQSAEMHVVQPEEVEQQEPPVTVKEPKQAVDEPTTPPIAVEPVLEESEKTPEQIDKKETSVADKMETKEDNSLAGKWNKNPISDLKSAIGLNDKFSFIHSLFDGKVDNYNEAIEKLNTSDGKEAATQYLNFLSSEYSWNIESEEYLKLKDFISRRFT